jgi:hypothetical protein
MLTEIEERVRVPQQLRALPSGLRVDAAGMAAASI